MPSSLFEALKRSRGLQGAPESQSETPPTPSPAAPTSGGGSSLFHSLQPKDTNYGYAPTPEYAAPKLDLPKARAAAEAMRKQFGGNTK